MPAREKVGSPFGQRASGAWAALRVPWYLRGAALEGLVRAPAGGGGRLGATGDRVDGGHAEASLRKGGATRGPADAPVGPAGEVRAALRAIRILARLRIPPFRNTCLFRSVAECLVLRRHGLAAVVRIGVRTDPGTGAVLAHAWVESPGAGAVGGDGHTYVVFNPEGAAPDSWSVQG